MQDVMHIRCERSLLGVSQSLQRGLQISWHPNGKVVVAHDVCILLP
jgi:hypothetical protein